MRITLRGITATLVLLLATAWLLVQADRISASPAVVNAQHLPPYWHQPVPTWCQEDMPCWIGSINDDRSDQGSMDDWMFQLRHSHDSEFVPRWLSCNVIDGSEFPRKAANAWQICYRNINNLGAHWRYVGHYDRHTGVWMVLGYTSVYVTRAGWFETS